MKFHKMIKNKRIKALFKGIRIIGLTFLSTPVVYFFVAIILSVIPVNSKTSKPAQKKYPMFLSSNGVHIDIVLPVSDSIVNWFEKIKFERKIQPFIHYLSFGWGNKEFYIHAPEWSDLTLKTALDALFLKGGAVLHVSPYHSISEDRNTFRIQLSETEYRQLVNYITASFKTDSSGSFIPFGQIKYSQYDTFYESTMRYSLFNTCNTWTNRALKKSGIKSCLWTPFDKGILYQYRNHRIKKE